MDPYIEEAVIIGDGRPCCVALIVPALDALRGWCQENGISMDDDSEWLNHRELEAFFGKRVAKINSRLSRHEAIRAFHLVEEAFSTENTMLTPTLKVRRDAVSEQYNAEIEALYASLNLGDHNRESRTIDWTPVLMVSVDSTVKKISYVRGSGDLRKISGHHSLSPDGRWDRIPFAP